MAMEKLILRSVMYGTDKIPDKWFEKVPGGFYKEKDGKKRNSGSGGSNRNSIESDRRRNRDDDDYDDDGYKSEGPRRRHERSRSSFDGGADDEDYDAGDDERRRRRSQGSHRRRRSLDDKRRRRGDDHDRSHRRGKRAPVDDERRFHGGPSPPREPYYDRDRPSTGSSDRSSNPFTPAPRAATWNTPYPRSSAHQSPQVQSPGFPPPPQPRGGSIANGYVPYANIYGQQKPPSPRQQYSPRPSSSTRSPQPNAYNAFSPPVAPPPQGYQQNPFAQQAPTAADAGAGAAYTGQQGFVNQSNQDAPWADNPDPYNSARRYTEYEENNPNPASPRPSSRPENSPSNDSYGSRTPDRRSRSERRTDGKSDDRAREEYDSTRHTKDRESSTNRSKDERGDFDLRNIKLDRREARRTGYYSD